MLKVESLTKTLLRLHVLAKKLLKISIEILHN